MYLLAQMIDIKTGARNNSHTLAMKNVMGNVSDSEMAAIAGWLSKQKPVIPVMPEYKLRLPTKHRKVNGRQETLDDLNLFHEGNGGVNHDGGYPGR